MKDLEISHLKIDHIRVVELNDEKAGLHGFIALHNNNLGSAVGGTRMYPYSSRDEALDDVLRLSKAMTYKCALAGMPHGGGKGVIIADPQKDKTKRLLATYARSVNILAGAFHTGEDVGINEEDVQYMLTISPYFIGKSHIAGDPSPYASLSTYVAMKAAARHVYGTSNLSGKKIAIKGVGKVGKELARLLSEDGAVLVIADIDASAVKDAQEIVDNVEIVDSNKIHELDVDIYSPCALGNEFTNKNYMQVKARLICGAANNQLKFSEIGKLLFDRGVVYVPDYVANAGGLINVADELDSGGYNNERVLSRINGIQKTIDHLFELSHDLEQPLNVVSDQLAESIFN